MAPPPLRLLTYNVHCCVGEDGAYDVGRVASVLRSVEASLVCLQEVECNTGPGGQARVFSAAHADDQPRLIARACGLQHVHFTASLRASVAPGEAGGDGEVLTPDPHGKWEPVPGLHRAG